MDALYSPPVRTRPGEITITPWSFQSLGVPLWAMSQVPPATAVWPAAGLVIFVPFRVPESVICTKMFWGVGTASGNLDCGIYDESANRLVSIGSTAASGSSSLQVVDTADTLLVRGRYYMALVADTGATLTIYRVAPAAGIGQSLGLLQQASVTLPLSSNASPATFAKYTQAYIPVVGLQCYRTVGP